MADNKFGLGRVKANIIKMKSELPRILANKSQNFFVEAFDKQGWEGESWKVPNRRIEGTKEYKYPKLKGLSRRVKPTLTMTGRLRRKTSSSVRTVSFQLVRLVNDVPYAKFHNDGTDKLPKRTFMKHSPTLERIQRQAITNYVDRLWRS